MIINSAEFVKSAVKPSHYPQPGFPEIAFAGRSNVGKSSLINTLVNRKRLVKTSATPGRTRLINFFEINGAFYFVDLPGFGYAKVPVAVKKTWIPMVETYITTRKFLKSVVLIMDIRRMPGDEEISCVDWLEHLGIPCMLIVTKTDKLSKNRQMVQRKAIAKAFAMDMANLILFSAKTRQGKEAILDRIEPLVRIDAEPGA